MIVSATEHGLNEETGQITARVDAMPKTVAVKTWNEHLIQLKEYQDPQAFQALFEHFAPRLQSFFYSRYTSSDDTNTNIEELVQEVMIKVWQKASSYNPDKAAASTWIFTLARNTYIDMLRKSNKYAGTSSLETEDIWEDETEHGPFTLLISHRDKQAVNVSLNELPQEQAEVIRKVYMEAKSHSEIAQELNLPLGTVKSRVRLAQQKLHDLLEH